MTVVRRFAASRASLGRLPLPPAFLLDGPNKTLRMRIAVRATERCLAHAHTRRLEQLTNRKTALPIAVADQDAESVEHALVRERRPGRPSALPEIRRLLVRMAIENPRWGWAHARADSSICAAPYVSRFGRFRSADAQSGASPSPSNLGLRHGEPLRNELTENQREVPSAGPPSRRARWSPRTEPEEGPGPPRRESAWQSTPRLSRR